jgi:hypothetical protein
MIWTATLIGTGIPHETERESCRSFRPPAGWDEGGIATDLDRAIYELFVNKEELLPLWLRLRPAIEGLGDDVRLEVRERYVQFDRGGREFAIAEPTAHHRIELGLHNPGLPFDERFREAVEFGSRRITHRVSLPEDAAIDDELHARLHDAYVLAHEGEPR